MDDQRDTDVVFVIVLLQVYCLMHVDAIHAVLAVTFLAILTLVGQIVIRSHKPPDLSEDQEKRKRVTW